MFYTYDINNMKDLETAFQTIGEISPIFSPLFNDGCGKRRAHKNFDFPDEGSKKCRKSEAKTASTFVPLKNFDPKNVSVSVNDKGLMTISASSESQHETKRNGLRRETHIMEETMQLPEYLLEVAPENASESAETDSVINDPDVVMVEPETKEKEAAATSASKNADERPKLISQVKTEFKNGGLLVSWPEKPKTAEQVREEKVKRGEPVEIKIDFV